MLTYLNAPSLVTSLSILLGIGAIHLVAAGHVGAAVICAALTIPCDVVDGWLARRLNQSTAFGGALDSLADAISFCVVPPVLAGALGVNGLLVPALALYTVCGLWRLARFAVAGNVKVGGDEYFIGLPTSVGAAAFFLVAAATSYLPLEQRRLVLAAYFALSGVAMIGGFRFPKRGGVNTALWALVPVGVVVLALRS